MPGEEFGAGVELAVSRQMDLMPMQHPVLLPVVEFLFDPVADLKTVVRGYGDIPSIKEFVDIRSKENSILDPVLVVRESTKLNNTYHKNGHDA